jgi:uncharacterized membrane protein YgdD (TMEM256/DUF423 family)
VRSLVILAGLYGALAVILGAFGAHGLRGSLEGLADGPRRLEWWQTGAHYHLVHATALAFTAWLATQGAGSWPRVAGYLFAGGVTVFSGTLYAMALGGPRVLGAVTPIGGLLLIAGWLCVLAAGVALSTDG